LAGTAVLSVIIGAVLLMFCHPFFVSTEWGTVLWTSVWTDVDGTGSTGGTGSINHVDVALNVASLNLNITVSRVCSVSAEECRALANTAFPVGARILCIYSPRTGWLIGEESHEYQRCGWRSYGMFLGAGAAMCIAGFVLNCVVRNRKLNTSVHSMPPMPPVPMVVIATTDEHDGPDGSS
jgi:hypothetical protein